MSIQILYRSHFQAQKIISNIYTTLHYTMLAALKTAENMLNLASKTSEQVNMENLENLENMQNIENMLNLAARP